MKSKIVSLSKNEDYKNLLKGKKVSNKYFTVFFKKLFNKNNKSLNISFVVKKKLGNAVKRNRAKRLMRSLVKEIMNQYGKNNFSYVLIAKKAIFKTTYNNLKKELHEMLTK